VSPAQTSPISRHPGQADDRQFSGRPAIGRERIAPPAVPLGKDVRGDRHAAVAAKAGDVRLWQTRLEMKDFGLSFNMMRGTAGVISDAIQIMIEGELGLLPPCACVPRVANRRRCASQEEVPAGC
jgi:hypothetical protein